MLYVICGPDRVGKSTLANEYKSFFPNIINIYHHGAPKATDNHIFDMYYKSLNTVLSNPNQIHIFDRSWLCSVALEPFRRNRESNIEDLYKIEYWILQNNINCTYILLKRDWTWTVDKHIEELKKEKISENSLIKELVFRNKEHHFYYEKIENYLTKHSLLKYITLENNNKLCTNLTEKITSTGTAYTNHT